MCMHDQQSLDCAKLSAQIKQKAAHHSTTRVKQAVLHPVFLLFSITP